MARVAILAAAAALTATAAPRAEPATRALRVESTVLLMRHGVRAPLSVPPLNDGLAAQPWATWPVGRADLTPHGRAGVRLLGRSDASLFAVTAAKAACPPAGSVMVAADNDERTIATAEAWIDGFAPGCGIVPVSLPPGQADPLFAPIEAGADAFDADTATRAVQVRLPHGGLPAVDADVRPLVARLDAVLCGRVDRARCGIVRLPTTLRAGTRGREPGLRGGLSDAARAIQTLTLEYAEGMDRPGWGRLTAADIAALGELRAREYAIVYRTPAVSRAFGGPTARRMLATIGMGSSAALTVLVGHDSNIAAVAGLLGLHWRVPGFAADDPPVSGAIGFQRLRDARGRPFVRAIFRSPSLDQIRSLAAPVPRDTVQVLPIAACAPTPLACPLQRFERLIEVRSKR